MYMTHFPVRVRDHSRITFYKRFVPSNDLKIFIHSFLSGWKGLNFLTLSQL